MKLTVNNDIETIKRGLSWVEIKDAFESEGCPICYIMLKSIKKYFNSLLYEYVLDAGVHKKMIASLGLCNTHTYLLMEEEKKLHSDGLNIAALYETSLQKEIKVIQRVNKNVRGFNKKYLTKFFKSNNELNDYKKFFHAVMNVTGECIGCENQKHTESYYTHEMLRLWTDGEFQELFSGGEILLCRNHFLFLVNEAEKRETINYFVNEHIRKLDKLYSRLEEFIRKHDYRFKNEMTDDDRKSWKKLLEYFGSKKNIDREGYNNLIFKKTEVGR